MSRGNLGEYIQRSECLAYNLLTGVAQKRIIIQKREKYGTKREAGRGGEQLRSIPLCLLN